MPRVTYDHQVFSWQQFGGISRYYYELARRVAKADGFTASVVAPLHISSYLAQGEVPVRGFKLPKLPKTTRVIAAANRVLAPLAVRASCPDVLHETYYRVNSYASGRYPTVVTVYDMIHEKFPNFFSSKDSTSASKLAAVSRAQFVICISENTRNDLIDIFGVSPEKTKTIRLGFSLTTEKEPIVSSLGFGSFILYVGNRRGYKNFDALLTAYASSLILRREFKLLAFGGGAFSADEQSRMRDLALGADSVRQVSGNDTLLGAIYRKAAALIYPSQYEGFGIPPLEAMSFDCPVICSNTSSMPEVVGDAAYLFDPYDVNAIRMAMEAVLESPDIRAELVRRGRLRIQHFSWDHCASETMHIYRQLAR